MRAWQAPAHGVRHARRWAATVIVLLVAALTGGAIAIVTSATAGERAEAGDDGVVHSDSAGASASVPDGPPPGLPDRTVPLPAVPQGEPMQVLIPAIDVDATLVPVGLRPDRAMEVPDFGLAGWYSRGPMPGHPGPAVIAAHVDSYAGPDVFIRLRELVAGDRVHVIYDSGDRITFVVTGSERTPKDALPVASMWPTTNDRLLALITCGGSFDPSARSYQDNVIVYSTPLDLVGDEGATGGLSRLQ
jgi:hypothetical protein